MIDNEIIAAIAAKIHDKIPDARIFDGEVPQDLKSGDFSVFLDNVNQIQQLFGFLMRTPTYSVYCFGAPTQAENEGGTPNGSGVELTIVQQKILPELKMLTFLDGSKIRAAEINAQIENDILKITVTYPYRCRSVDDAPNMETMEIRR
jgi:hypothetical protein